MELQLKRIHDEYLSKMTEITRKNIEICSSNIVESVNDSEQSLSNDSEESSKKESIINDNSTFNKGEGDYPISKVTNRIKAIEDDIHEYCFENMIKHKPIIIQYTNK